MEGTRQNNRTASRATQQQSNSCFASCNRSSLASLLVVGLFYSLRLRGTRAAAAAAAGAKSRRRNVGRATPARCDTDHTAMMTGSTILRHPVPIDITSFSFPHFVALSNTNLNRDVTHKGHSLIIV